jgi:hypothetical protein
MATLYVTEYSLNGWVQTPPITAPPLQSIQADYNVAIGGTSTPSPAFQAATGVIQINCDAACSIAYGGSPTAVVTAHRMAANETRFYLVKPGDKLAVIANN